MTREEEIRQAVREYTDVAKSYLLGDEIELVRNAYEAGAEWADEHPINITPKMKRKKGNEENNV